MMATDSICRVCLVNNMNLFCVRNDLQNVYETLSEEKFNIVGYPVHMCYICLTVLRKCHRFMETARDTNNMLKQWFKQQNEMRVSRPLYTYTISKVEVALYSADTSLQNDIKVEKVESEHEAVRLENMKCNIEKTDVDEQTNYSEIWVEIQNDNSYTDTVEDSHEIKIDPIKNIKETSDSASDLDDHTNIKRTIKIISAHDNDAPPVRKRKTNETKPQHRAPETSGEPGAKHMRCDEDSTPHVCDICNCRFSGLSYFNTHMKSHTDEKPFACNICGYRGKQKVHLERHMRTHTGEKPYSCGICDHRFKHKDRLTQHMRIHTGEKPYSCNICDYKCRIKDTLITHIRTHTGEKPFLCYICSHRFTQKSVLKSHMRTHTGEKPYSCEVCDYKCARKGALKTHMKTHTGEKPFSCEVCDYKCSVKGSLKAHMKTHTGEKPYACEICDFKCIQKIGLELHMRTHTGEKPFSCDICDYKSNRKEVLTLHMRTHTGEKPFPCELCDYKSARKAHLKKHMRTHTGEKPVGGRRNPRSQGKPRHSDQVAV